MKRNTRETEERKVPDGAVIERELPEGLCLIRTAEGLALAGDGMYMIGDFAKLYRRVKGGNLGREMLVKAARFKNIDHTPVAVDATAGMGEDSFLLAAAGFEVHMFEYNEVIAALLEDALARAKVSEEIPQIAEIASRMFLHSGDSIAELRKMGAASSELQPDLVYLDPMFPARQKSGMIQKKFQLLQRLEQPCGTGEELLDAAVAASPLRIVVKRPAKGPVLGGRKPSYEIKGSVIRYDCIVL